MADSEDPRLKIFKLYLATAEKVSDRRAKANSWMLSVNSAIVGLYGYLQAGKMMVDASQKEIWLWAIPAAGAIVCIAWAALLASYRKLNRAKFAVLTKLEADMQFAPFTREEEYLKSDKRVPLSRIELWVPGCFCLLYAIMLAASFLR
jgi:hypothetical protein